MDLNDLNKNQIILLTLLVSFVTSIATGIVTVTLLDQAPKGVTQTINRVVERTVERVVPGETKVTTITKEVPVVVTEEQLVVDVITKASPAVVKILDTSVNPAVIAGTGFLVSADGLVATAFSIIKSDKKYAIALEDNQIIATSVVKLDQGSGLAILKADLGSTKPLLGSGDNNKAIFLAISKEPVAIGQTVIAIGYSEPDSTVAVGIVSGISSSTPSQIIRTNAATQTNIGGPLLDIKGEIIGINKEPGLAIPARALSTLLTQ